MPEPDAQETNTGPLPRLTYSVREVAEALGVGTRHVERMCQGGELRHLRLGRRLLIPAAALDELLKAAEVKA
jgi:excisionase family DNA binding protein